MKKWPKKLSSKSSFAKNKGMPKMRKPRKTKGRGVKMKAKGVSKM